MLLQNIIKYVKSDVPEDPQQLSMSQADCLLPADDNEMNGVVLVIRSSNGDIAASVRSCLRIPVSDDSADWIHDVSMQDCPERNESQTDARVFAYKAFLVSSVFDIKDLKLAAAGNTALTALILPNYDNLSLTAPGDLLTLFNSLENSVNLGLITRHIASCVERSNSIGSASSGDSAGDGPGSPLVPSPEKAKKQGSFWKRGPAFVDDTKPAKERCCRCIVS